VPPTAEPDDPYRAGIDALRELILAGHHFRQSVADVFGIGVTETAAISYLAARGDLGQTELARYLGITTSSATSLIDRLQANGWVTRVPHPGDRRRMSVRLTDQANQAVHDTRHWFRGALGTLTDDEMPLAADILTRVAAGLRSQHDEMQRRNAAPAVGPAAGPPSAPSPPSLPGSISTAGPASSIG
jgi:DNA-binding MarR family transcriptional regulator